MDSIDFSNLKSFENGVAGHDGVLSDADGTLVIKPCTETEIKFYTRVNASIPELAIHIPTFFGTLQLSDTAKDEAGDDEVDTVDVDAAPAKEEGTASTLGANDAGPMHGKKLDTDISIVLGNLTAGFEKPNILDLKLGARLWDDESAPAKRARLDEVARTSTSGSLGFRIAGMKVWDGPASSEQDTGSAKGKAEAEAKTKVGAEHVTYDDKTGYRIYNKLYGRAFDKDNVVDAIVEYVNAPRAGVTGEYAREVLRQIEEVVDDIRVSLSVVETRMYSASLLIVYEGDPVAGKAAIAVRAEALKKREEEKRAAREEKERMRSEGGNKGDDEEEEEDSDEESDVDEDEFDRDPLALVPEVKLLDFAHATVVEGEGPDENTLQGVRSVIAVLNQAVKRV